MKKTRTHTKLATGLALGLCIFATDITSRANASVAYTSTYSGNELPSASTPEWYVDSTSGSSANIVDGKLQVSTMHSADSLHYWALGTSDSTPWGTASAWNTSTATIDFRVSVIDSMANSSTDPRGFWIQVADNSNRFWNFFIGDNKFYSTNIQSGDVTSIDLSELGVNTSDFNVYRIALQDGLASVYINDLAAPVINSLSGVSFINRTAILFGDAASFESALFQLDYLNWSNTTATFAAPIPEPSILGLLTFGGVGAFLGLARRRKSQR